MPIYTKDPCDDGAFPMRHPLQSSIGIGLKVTKAIDAATKDWLDEHPEATTTVKENSLEERHLKSSLSLELCRCFDIVTDMQAATDLKAGMICHTNGFHSVGDGGATFYQVTTDGEPNGMDVLTLQDGLIATLIVTEPYVTPEQLGAYGDSTHDDSTVLQFAINNYHNVHLLTKKYGIGSTIECDIAPFSLCGATTGYSVNNSSELVALSGFHGEYLIKSNGIDIGGAYYSRAVSIYNLEMDCRNLCGGIYIYKAYDNCCLSDIFVHRIPAQHIGIALDGSINQGISLIRVLAETLDTATSESPLMQFKRLQECTLTSVKAFCTNRTAIEFLGCVGVTIDTCAVTDTTTHEHVGFSFAPSSDNIACGNIQMINCLNEGCGTSLNIQNARNFECINFVNLWDTTYTPKINIDTLKNGIIQCGQSRNINIITEFILASCTNVRVIKNQNDIITSNGGASIENFGPEDYYITTANSNVILYERGIGSVINVFCNIKNSFTTIRGAAESVTIDDHYGILCNDFTHLTLRFDGSTWRIINCDGGVTYLSGQSVVDDVAKDSITCLSLTSSAQIDERISGVTIDNTDATTNINANIAGSAAPNNFTMTVIAVVYQITVNLSGITFPDGSTSFVVPAGSIVTFAKKGSYFVHS